MSRLKGDTIPGLILVIIGLLFLIPSIGFGIMPTTSDGVLGAGFFPAVISIGVIIAGAGYFIKGLRENGAVEYFYMDEEQKGNLKPFFITIAATLIFMLLWHVIDFFIATTIFCLFINWIYKRSWKFNVLFTGIFVAGIYLAFTVFLKIQFDL